MVCCCAGEFRRGPVRRSAQDSAVLRRVESPWYGWLALGIGLFVVSRYLPMLVGSASEEPLPDEFADDPAMFWTIALLDLGVVVPAAVASAVVTWRQAECASKALYALLGWFVLVPVSVAAMAVAMLVNDDPNKSMATTVMFGAAALVFTGFAWWVHKRLTSRTGIAATGDG